MWLVVVANVEFLVLVVEVVVVVVVAGIYWKVVDALAGVPLARVP